MNAHCFLLSGPVHVERLSWIEESLKFYFVQLFPETLTHQKVSESPVSVFFLTGDALFSLEDPECLQVWNIILSFAPVRVHCDRQELDLRGIRTEPLKMKYPDQVIDTCSLDDTGKPSFWKDLAAATRQTKHPQPETMGWFQTESPYMHRSAWYGLCFLTAAIGERISAELYAYLDGFHIGHQGQHPTDAENIGETVLALHDRAVAARLDFLALACGHCATARGYSTWDDGKGSMISTCTIRAFRIRDISRITGRFLQPHVILAGDCASLQIRKQSPVPAFDHREKAGRFPPVTILVTRRPYSTELAAGAVSFAASCAHAGILTRVIFIEDGIYCLTGNHRTPSGDLVCPVQDMINLVAGSENLHFFAFTPSFQKRGITKEKNLNAVLDIGYPGLGKIFFYPPGNSPADHHRVLFF